MTSLIPKHIMKYLDKTSPKCVRILKNTNTKKTPPKKITLIGFLTYINFQTSRAGTFLEDE